MRTALRRPHANATLGEMQRPVAVVCSCREEVARLRRQLRWLIFTGAAVILALSLALWHQHGKTELVALQVARNSAALSLGLSATEALVGEAPGVAPLLLEIAQNALTDDRPEVEQ